MCISYQVVSLVIRHMCRAPNTKEKPAFSSRKLACSLKAHSFLSLSLLLLLSLYDTPPAIIARRKKNLISFAQIMVHKSKGMWALRLMLCVFTTSQSPSSPLLHSAPLPCDFRCAEGMNFPLLLLGVLFKCFSPVRRRRCS